MDARLVAIAVASAACACRCSTPPPAPDLVVTADVAPAARADVLADDQSMPAAVAVDATHVYWTNAGKGAVRRIPKAGGAVETLWERADAGAVAIAIDATHAYFATPGALWRVPKGGGPAETLASVERPKRVAVDDEAVYFVTAGRVARVSKAGGAVTPLGAGDDVGDGAVDDAFVYWVQRDGVLRVPKKGGAPLRLARGAFRFTKLAVGATDVTWGDAALQAIFAVPKAGGRVRYVAHAWNVAGRQLAVDGADLLVVGGGGTIERVDPATGRVSVVASNLDRGGDADHRMMIAVDGPSLYVAAGGASIHGAGPEQIFGGALLRVPRVGPGPDHEEQGGAVQVGIVWFDGTTMQDAAKATRWEGEMPDDVLAAIRAGRLRVRLVAETGGEIDEGLARARAQVVADALRSTLGAGARLVVATAPPRGYHGDVEVALDPDDVSDLLTPP